MSNYWIGSDVLSELEDVLGADAITDKSTVKSVQGQLQLIAKNSGNSSLNPGSVDGILGSKTKSAVAAFNTAYGWPSDGGVITQGTMTALARPDVVRLTQGAQASSVTFADDEAVASRKQVVEQVKQANDAVQAAVDAKAKASTPVEKQAADMQAKAAQVQADAVAKAATSAPPDVKQAIAAVQSAAQSTVQAQTPQQIAAAQSQAVVADDQMKSIRKMMLWVPVVIGLVSLLGVGATVTLAIKSKWLWAAITFLLITPVVATGAGIGTAAAVTAVNKAYT